jgi:prepilin-type processing-associated H-X9-DG protein/prepilin-type N-terminal cleavage/methylation domain-containing protein
MRRSCFTLIELLVVIAIITVLTAILLPSLRNSRQQAHAALCSSNTKQLLLGLLSYETDNQVIPFGFDNTPMVPPRGGYAGGSACDKVGWWWFNHIAEYTSKKSIKDSIIWCPSRQIKDSRLKGNILCGNYGVNLSICKNSNDIPSRKEKFVGTPLCTEDIPHPSQTLLILDSGYSLISWWHATDIPPVPLGKSREDTSYVPGLHINANRYIWPGEEEDAINGRHPNKTVNVGFADSHVEKKKAESLFVEKTADGYKNKSPLWQPK